LVVACVYSFVRLLRLRGWAGSVWTTRKAGSCTTLPLLRLLPASAPCSPAQQEQEQQQQQQQLALAAALAAVRARLVRMPLPLLLPPPPWLISSCCCTSTPRSRKRQAQLLYKVLCKV
jgi:hypothetical protein